MKRGHRLAGVSMKELSRYLFLAGALPFLLLGTAHAVHTPRQPYERKGLSKSDPSLSWPCPNETHEIQGRREHDVEGEHA